MATALVHWSRVRLTKHCIIKRAAGNFEASAACISPWHSLAVRRIYVSWTISRRFAELPLHDLPKRRFLQHILVIASSLHFHASLKANLSLGHYHSGVKASDNLSRDWNCTCSIP